MTRLTDAERTVGRFARCRRVACRHDRHALDVLRNHFRRIARGRSKEATNAKLLLWAYGTTPDRNEFDHTVRTRR